MKPKHTQSHRDLPDGLELVSSKDVASLLGVTTHTLNRWSRLGKGPPRIKVGRKAVYRRASLIAWLEANEARDCTRVHHDF